MSDRPMRLKYLTKMMIILCSFLLFITAVSVSGQSQELNGIVGKRIVFPAKVETSGNLIYSSTVLGHVSSGALIPLTDSEYKGRVQWDKSTGLFSLSELRLEDSGVYTVESDGQKSVSTFSLTAWKDNVNVSKPHVNVTHNKFHCTLLCTAERGTGVTLSWYREGQKKPYGSYPVRDAPDLYLPQTVHKGGIYTCEAKNSVSNEKASITVRDHCTDSNIWMIVAIVFGLIAVAVPVPMAFLGVYLYRKGCCRKNAVIFDGSTFQEFLEVQKNQERGS